MDNTTGLAAQMAYQLLFTLAPGLLFLWHLLGLFGTDPAKLHRMFVILKEFLPPDPKVQDILDSALASVVVTGSSGWIANVGIIAGIYLGTMFISTVSRALSHTHGVVEDRHWWSKYIISFFLLFWFGLTILVCFNAVVFGETLAGIAEVNLQLKDSASGVGRSPESAAHSHRPHYSGPRPLSADSGKLSYHPPGPAGRDFIRSWLAGSDEIVPALCLEIRSLQPNLSRSCFHHHFADLDVFDLFVVITRRKTKRDSAPRTGARVANCRSCAPACLRFFCDVRAGESFLFVFVDSLRFQRSTRLRAGFV